MAKLGEGTTKFNPRKEYKRRAAEALQDTQDRQKKLEAAQEAYEKDPYKGGMSAAEKMLTAATAGGAAAAGTVATGAGLERAAMGLGEEGFQAQTIAEGQQQLADTIEGATARGAGVAEQASLAQSQQAKAELDKEESDIFARQQYADQMMQQSFQNRLQARQQTFSDIANTMELASKAATMATGGIADIGSLMEGSSWGDVATDVAKRQGLAAGVA